MKLHYTDKEIIVTKLMPVSELKTTIKNVLIFIKERESVEFFGVFCLTDDGYLSDGEDFNVTPDEIECAGWLPIPIYQEG